MSEFSGLPGARKNPPSCMGGKLTKLLNRRRLLNYPRLILAGIALALALNVLLGQGWLGMSGQVIGTDFVTLYSAGVLYRQDIHHLYDFAAQGQVQQELIYPTPLPGINFFTYPPHAAWLYSLLALVPFTWAFVLWTALTLLFIALAVYWLQRFLTPARLIDAGLGYWQLVVVALSFFPFVEGFQVGQNHGLTFLLVTGMVVFSVSGRWWAAGAMAALLIYKPHFVLGFLIVWLVWQKYRALASFTVVAAVVVASVVLSHGIAPYLAYLAVVPQLLEFPYQAGYPAFLQLTPYGLLTTLLPYQALPGILVFTQALTVGLTVGLAWVAYRLRRRPESERSLALMLAILYPLLIAPHTLLHDLMGVIPFFLMWAQKEYTHRVLYAAVAVYLGAFLLPWPSHLFRLAFLSLIPMGLLAMQIRRMWVGRREILGLA